MTTTFGHVELIQEAPALLELAAIALHRQVAGDDHQVGVELVRLRDGGAQQLAAEESLANVQVRHLDDPHGTTATAGRP